MRQRPNRYTIRAGRNLPDKEFRYLRTVIVTAAVYRGFISKLLPLHSSPCSITFPRCNLTDLRSVLLLFHGQDAVTALSAQRQKSGSHEDQ